MKMASGDLSMAAYMYTGAAILVLATLTQRYLLGGLNESIFSRFVSTCEETSGGGPLTVAIVGCGPGGMFFLHAIETYRRELKAAGLHEKAAQLPVATCYDKASAPGGVWRPQRSFQSGEDVLDEESSKEGSVEMYEALWTNAPKEGIEFWDYTFEDHYGVGIPLPAFMPRGAVLDYMMARVTRNNLDLFEKHGVFGTEIEKVTYNEAPATFTLTSRSIATGQHDTTTVDRLIWSAGTEGKPYIPGTYEKIFQNFTGRVIHSSDASRLKQDVSGKKILLIGGSWSAEDLALMAIKLGVEHVFISIREYSILLPVLWQAEWPHHKVTILEEEVPARVQEDGQTIELVAYDAAQMSEVDKVTTVLKDIETVIYCTGYTDSFDDAEANIFDESVYGMSQEQLELYLKGGPPLDIPEGWTMPENELSAFVGDVPFAKDILQSQFTFSDPYFYRGGVFTTNPNLMRVDGSLSSSHLLSMDVQARYLLKIMVGDISLPSLTEMKRQSREDALLELSIPAFRSFVDRNYKAALREVMEENDEESAAMDASYNVFAHATELFELSRMALMMNEADYFFGIGSSDGLNEYGELLFNMSSVGRNFDANGTLGHSFRDLTPGHCRRLRSLHTGAYPVPFNAPWMQLSDLEDPRTLVGL
mmetsp:Transcript_36073/g.78997  ORF Transcript_36073/g.78997 Transcript_36073/m.78997 type:complete len:647 (+) Transcript_36073:92-2032(+)